MGQIAGLVVHSNGWDEITLDSKTNVAEFFKGRVTLRTWTNRDFGLPKVASRHLAGGDATANATAIRAILAGEKLPARDVIVANAAALIWIADRAFKGKAGSLKEAVKKAQASIDSGAALEKCARMAETSRMIER
jgi:anthranilate phosphoribosyltransferase